MSTVIPVILVSMGRYYNITSDVLTVHLDNTGVPLVLLMDDPDQTPPEGVEWESVIQNTGGKNGGQFRANAYDILVKHSNMVPIAVVEHDPRYRKTWDLPLLVDWSEL